MSGEQQLALFEASPVAEVVAGWYVGLPDREDGFGFTHLIRAKGDPERPPRGAVGATDWKRVNDLTVAQWARRIEAHLGDGTPRTFNRIAVELTGFTADVVFGENPDGGLWHAVQQGRVAWSADGPVHFTLVECLK